MKKIRWICFLAIMVVIAAFSKSAALAAPAQNASFTAKLDVACLSPKTEQAITLKATASSNDSSKTYQYKFVWQRNNWADWGVVKNFSSESTIVFTPTKPGTYVFIVDVRDNEGTVISKYSEKVKIDLCWSSPSIKITQKPANIGSPVNLEGTVNSNSKSPLKYKFVWSRDNWKSWGVIKNFNTTSGTSFIPKQPGKYRFYMDVMDAAGTVITAQSEEININLGWTPSATFSAPTKVIGNPITMSGSVKSDIAIGHKYKFVWCKDNWKDWGVISNLSSTNSASYTPTKAGTYRIYADFQDDYGNIKTIVSEEMKISTGWTPFVNLSSPNQTVDSPISINTGVTNLSKDNSFQYKIVWSRNNWQEWKVLKDFNSQTTATYTPTKNGTYTIYVDVMDKYGNVITTSKSMYINARWKSGTPKISLNGQYPGSTATIRANVSGDTSGVQYKYVWSYNDWSEWGVIKNFSNSTSVNFTANKAGKYDIYVDVMDSAGSTATSVGSFTINSKSFRLIVNMKTQTVIALGKSADGSYTSIVRTMPCSTGRVAGYTPTGTFSIQAKYRWRALQDNVYGQWSSRIYKGILFHSVPYKKQNNLSLVTNYYNQLGSPASAGCVRLRAVDTKWIYDNCPVGTPVEIGYFNRPEKAWARKIKSTTTWDPTDPSLSSAYYDKGWQ